MTRGWRDTPEYGAAPGDKKVLPLHMESSFINCSSDVSSAAFLMLKLHDISPAGRVLWMFAISIM